jgi:hypothetical protein
MKFKDIIKKKPLVKEKEKVTAAVQLSVEIPISLNSIYEFAEQIASEAENKFNLSYNDGELIYQSLLVCLKHLKDYPKE